MYCPKCGGVLESRWSPWHERFLLHCPRGDMGLSPFMQDALEARYGHDHAAPQSPLPPSRPSCTAASAGSAPAAAGRSMPTSPAPAAAGTCATWPTT